MFLSPEADAAHDASPLGKSQVVSSVCPCHLWKPTGGQNTRGSFRVGLDMFSNMFQQTLPARRDPVLLPHTIAGFCWLPAKTLSPTTYRGAVKLAFGVSC